MITSQTLPINKSFAALAAILLWALLAFLGVLCILALREIVLALYVLSLPIVPTFGDFVFVTPRGYNQVYWLGVTLMQWTTILAAILWIGVVIGGAEYLSRNYRQAKTWKRLSWLIGLELVVLVLGYLV